MTLTAVIAVRPQQADFYTAAHAGMKRLGYATVDADSDANDVMGDALVTWNLHGWHNVLAEKHKARGAPVLVAENGYCGRDGEGNQMLALARDAHNGAGTWPHKRDALAPQDRWLALGLDVEPWGRRKIRQVLVCAQRGIGSPGMASPGGWGETTADRLRAAGYDVTLRRHPGRFAPEIPLADHLAWSDACVVWSSNCAVHALIAGVPVFYAAPTCIAAPASRRLGPAWLLDDPLRDDMMREVCLRRMAWAQWSAAEIASGGALAAVMASR